MQQPNQPSNQQSQLYQQQRIQDLLSNFSTPQTLNENQQRRINNVNDAGRNFAQVITQNTSTSPEQTRAVERAVEGAQWAIDAIQHGK